MGGNARNCIPALGLDGLAKQWEAKESIRRQVLMNRHLLQWRSSDHVGVPCFKSAALNFEVLELFFRAWVAVAPSKRTPSQPACKKEAPGLTQE